MEIGRRTLMALLGTGAGSRIVDAFAAGSDTPYPTRSITVLLPYTVGGPPDLLVETIKATLEPLWGQTIIAESRPGANGIIACELAARARPDGYTLLMGSVATQAINPAVYKTLPYNPAKDFVPVVQVGETPIIITGHPASPAKTLPELIAYAKASPHPLTFAATGRGSLGDLTALMFQMRAGVKLTDVAYPGIAEAMTDLLAGRVDLGFTNVPNPLPFIKSGQLRAYGVTSLDRLPILPDVPVVADTLPKFEATLWWGLFAPAKTPPAIVTKLNTAVQKIVHTPDIKAKWANEAVFLTGDTPAAFASLITAETAKWQGIAQAAGISHSF